MRRLFLFSMMVVIILGLSAQQKTKVMEIDGIRNVQNPEAPAKGTILLDVEKRLEINPYDTAEVDLKYFQSARMDDGRVILFDVNRSKAYIFSSQGKFAKDLIRNGQGPGEFLPRQMMYVHPMQNQIFVSGGRKVAKFDGQGVFIEDFPVDDGTMTFIDQTSYLTETLESTKKESFVRNKVIFKRFREKGKIVEGPVYKEGVYLGYISNPDHTGGFGDEFCLPGIEYAYDPLMKRVYLAERAEHAIKAYDLSGKKIFISRTPFEQYKITRKEVEKMYGLSLEDKWMIDAYPNKLMATVKLSVLPKGYLAVYRIVGPLKYEIDVFDKEGVWQYIFKLPEGLSLGNENFYDFGFSYIEIKDDFPIYVEYRVKNLPEVFGK